MLLMKLLNMTNQVLLHLQHPMHWRVCIISFCMCIHALIPMQPLPISFAMPRTMSAYSISCLQRVPSSCLMLYVAGLRFKHWPPKQKSRSDFHLISYKRPRLFPFLILLSDFGIMVPSVTEYFKVGTHT